MHDMLASRPKGSIIFHIIRRQGRRGRQNGNPPIEHVRIADIYAQIPALRRAPQQPGMRIEKRAATEEEVQKERDIDIEIMNLASGITALRRRFLFYFCIWKVGGILVHGFLHSVRYHGIRGKAYWAGNIKKFWDLELLLYEVLFRGFSTCGKGPDLGDGIAISR